MGRKFTVKLLLENWRKYLINERKTDQTYENLINYLIKKVIPNANWWTIDKEDRNVAANAWGIRLAARAATPKMNPLYWGKPPEKFEEVVEDGEIIFVFIPNHLPDVSVLENEYFRDYPEDKETFVDGQFLKQFVGNFKIVVWPLLKNAAGSMYNNGQLNINARWLYLFTFEEPGPRPPPLTEAVPPPVPPVHYDVMSLKTINSLEAWAGLSGRQVHSALASGNEFVRKILVHEIAHYINAIRAKGETWRGKGGRKQFDPSTQEYIDSTEELQARLMDLFNKIEKDIKSNKGIGPDLKRYLDDIANGVSAQDFISAAVSVYKQLYGAKYYDKLSQSNKKRVLSRMYQFALNMSKKYGTPEENLETPILEHMLKRLKNETPT